MALLFISQFIISYRYVFFSLQTTYFYFISWEPQGGYHCSKMFRWEPEGRSRCTKSMGISVTLLVLNKTSLNSDSALQTTSFYFVSWEPEGRYQCSKMFCWELEGRSRCTKSMGISPFWFSTKHLWIVIVPFWLTSNGFFDLLLSCFPCVFLSFVSIPSSFYPSPPPFYSSIYIYDLLLFSMSFFLSSFFISSSLYSIALLLSTLATFLSTLIFSNSFLLILPSLNLPSYLLPSPSHNSLFTSLSHFHHTNFIYPSPYLFSFYIFSSSTHSYLLACHVRLSSSSQLFFILPQFFPSLFLSSLSLSSSVSQLSPLFSGHSSSSSTISFPFTLIQSPPSPAMSLSPWQPSPSHVTG